MGRNPGKVGVRAMARCAFVFPGQSSQYVGMGKDLYEVSEIARSTFEEANAALGFDLTNIAFNGPIERLKETLNTQPAIVMVSIALFRVLDSFGVRPEVVAGHSLGEYSALIAAGSITFRDGIQLVRERGRFMEEACPHGKGTMAAVLGLEIEAVEEARKKGEVYGIIDIANLNCPGQVVLSGEVRAIEEACRYALALGAKRCVPLQVSGPFHSRLMAPAARQLEAKLEGVEVRDPAIPFIANVSGEYVGSARVIKENLVKQVISTVQWERSVREMIAGGVEVFIEVGPGSVLTGLIKRISREVRAFSVENSENIKKVLEILKEAG